MVTTLPHQRNNVSAKFTHEMCSQKKEEFISELLLG